MTTWQDKWITPAVLTTLVTAIFGAIVWGVQLNIAVVGLTESISGLNAETRVQREDLNAVSQQMARTALILESVEKRISKTEMELESHEKEAAEWKYRIIQLEGSQ